MKTILELSHTNQEVEHPNTLPMIFPEYRELVLFDKDEIAVKTYDLFDVEKVTWYPR